MPMSAWPGPERASSEAIHRPVQMTCRCRILVVTSTSREVRIVIKIETSIDIDRPVTVVWPFIGDPRTLPEWDPGVRRVELEGAVGVGSTFTITAEFIGGDLTSSGRITGFEPGRRISWRIAPPGSARLWGDSWIGATYAVEDMGEARSRLTRTFEASGHGLLGRLVEPLIRRRARRERFDEVMNVKRAAEGSHDRSG
jgi:carbon monoxide dehydrogenase subunit G